MDKPLKSSKVSPLEMLPEKQKERATVTAADFRITLVLILGPFSRDKGRCPQNRYSHNCLPWNVKHFAPGLGVGWTGAGETVGGGAATGSGSRCCGARVATGR